jgi:hypothetical protein
MSRQEGVKRADGLATPSQRSRDRGEAIRSALIEREYRDALYERADEAVKLPRSLCLGAEA